MIKNGHSGKIPLNPKAGRPEEGKERKMKKLIGLVLAMMLLAGIAISATAEEAQGREMYVYTKNGKVLLVRSSPSTTENNVVNSLPYGSKVMTYGSPEPGWTYVEWGNNHGYVMSRFLTNKKPEARDGSSSSTAKSSGFNTEAATTVNEINTLLASAKQVAPYNVAVRPARASGWVCMYWLPTKNATQIATYSANQELTVIAELQDWYQVEDPSTGMIGFVYQSYVQ